MSSTVNTDQALAALQADVAALKQDLTSLLSHLKSGATGSAQAAAAQIDQGAQTLYRNAAAGGERSLKALGNQIEEQPLLALLVLLGVGYVGGRLLTR
jgi:ElaB/YqjD/DUF883 family membrane-anchored ribosome-binding protein